MDSFCRYGEETPFANVHQTILNRLGMPIASFADSTGELAEVR